MIVPDTPIQQLPEDATLQQVIAKLNEVIAALNEMWNPEDGG